MKPRYSAPAFNIIPPIKHANFSPKRYFHSYSYVGNNENFSIEYNFDHSLEMRYSGVKVYIEAGGSWGKKNTKLRSKMKSVKLNKCEEEEV